MCKRDTCPECGASALEACKHENSTDNCAREVEKCPTCGAASTEPCLEEA